MPYMHSHVLLIWRLDPQDDSGQRLHILHLLPAKHAEHSQRSAQFLLPRRFRVSTKLTRNL
jgi:hypothetical protein